MKQFLSLIIFITYSVASNAQCNELFFSEYIEGSGSNKAFEIYNPTSGPITLDNYEVKKYTNGATVSTSSISLTGTLAAGDVYVVTNSSATTPGIIAASDITSGVTNFNGDDAMELINTLTGTTIDIIGVIGVDPGSSWPVGTGATNNNSLIRKMNVNSGNTDWTTASAEWDVYAIDMADSLGMHSMTACAPSCASFNSIVAYSCVTYTAPSGNAHTMTSVFFDTIPNNAGCDSIITIDLTINPVYNESVSASICTGDTYVLGTQNLTATGIYTELFSSVDGCDSTVNLDLTVVASYTTNTTDTICAGESFVLGTQTLTMSGPYTEVLVSSGGCDSTVNIVLTVNPTSSSSVTASACESYTSPSGAVWTTSNTYMDTLPNTLGCDSIITIDLTINQPTSSTMSETACGSYDLNGTTYTSSGVYTQVVPNSIGCDSTITLTLDITIVPNMPIASADSSYCEGDAMSDMWVQSNSKFDSLIISGVADATLTGGVPKYVEFYAIYDIADLSNYGFGSANNGGGTDGVEYTFPAMPLTAGSYFIVATDSTNFFTFYGFYPNGTDQWAGNVNGDDAVELFTNVSTMTPVVIDVFGDINVDGTGEAWEYQDGWAYRNTNTAPNGGTFNIGEWTFSGPNALDNASDNATSGNPVPVQTYTFAVPTSTFTWYTDAGLTNMAGTGATLTPGATTQTYYVVETFTGSSTCSSAADMVTNTVSPIPVVTFGALTDVCADYAAFTLSEGLPANGTYSGNGVVSPQFDPSVAGIGTHTLTYMFMDANGCSASATSDIIVEDCLGIDDLFASTIQLFPNPANGEFALSFEQTKANVSIMDLNGSIISTNEVVSNENIDISTLSTGTYLVQITIDTHTFTKRLTVK